jgi:hypothetical protein
MKILIFGDSFSSDQVNNSWVDLLSRDHSVTNHSQRGISEFRIYKIFLENIQEIKQTDAVIILHTNPDRVYVPDHVMTPSRRLPSHLHCDMLVNDSLEKWMPAEVYYKNFYDQDLQNTLYGFIIDNIRKHCENVSLLEFSGFDIGVPGIHSIYNLRIKHPGNINHLDATGNLKFFEKIKDTLG